MKNKNTDRRDFIKKAWGVPKLMILGALVNPASAESSNLGNGNGQGNGWGPGGKPKKP